MPRSGTISLAGLGLALRLHALDRWPTLVSSPRVWDRLGFAEPFDYRWNSRPVPAETQRAYDAVASLETSTPVLYLRSARNDRIARHRLADGMRIDQCNAGPGGRMSNSAQTAVAVDHHLNGCPATAMPWGISKDPVRLFKLSKSLDGARTGQAIATPKQLRRLVASWGPGGKGVVSLRDPAHAFHRVFNATNVDGRVAFHDYSRSAPISPAGGINVGDDAAERARQALEAVDPRSPFASIQVWRTKNTPGASRLADHTLAMSDNELLDEVAAAVPSTLPAELLPLVVSRLRGLDNIEHAHILLQQLHDGASTHLPHDLTALEKGTEPEPEALTALDQALIACSRSGHVSVQGSVLEITLPDDAAHRLLAERFVGRTERNGAIDGLAPGTFEICVDSSVLEQRHIPTPCYEAPDRIAIDVPPIPATQRQRSWVEANRIASPGTRATNCWNCAASTANWIVNRQPSSALPVYDDAPYRPQIADYLETMGAAGPPEFIETIEDAERVAQSWGPWKHGLVVCSLTKDSTHIFNVVHYDGQVRFLDSHMGRDGAYNFDTDWMRIGIVELGRWRLL